ncbi:MAG: hypothetical protein RIB43_15855 [Rhodospirillaceae bacterium]
MGPSFSNKLSFSVSIFAITITVASVSGTAEAQMKAKYYKECYAPIEQARAMIPEPKADVGESAGKLGSAAGALGKIGGFGGFGGLGKVAQTAATIEQYSGYVASAAALTEKMQSDYPDPADRILAYGEQLGEDANKIQTGAETLEAAQTCYDDAYTKLVADFEAGEIKKKEAKNQHREIQKGMIEINAVLADAQQVMDTNLQNYNEALTTETTGMGLNLGDMAQAASLAQGAAGSAGIGSVGSFGGTVTSRTAGSQAILRQGAAYRARALGNLGAMQASQGAIPAAANVSPASFGIMNDFAMMGNMSALSNMSGTGGAIVGSQIGIGAIQSAINNRNDAQPTSGVAPTAQPELEEQPAPPQISQEMMASLQAAGVSSAKFMESYGQVALTTERQFEVTGKVGQSAGW